MIPEIGMPARPGAEPRRATPPPAAEHGGRGCQDDPQIPQERPGPDVHRVEVLQIRIREIAAPGHLPQAGEAGAHVETRERSAVQPP